MDYKKKQEAICKLWHNKVFDTASTKYTDRNFPKEVLGYKDGRCSFQKVIYGEAGKDGVNIIWNKLKKYYKTDDDFLFALAKVTDYYDKILSDVGTSIAAYDWISKYWFLGEIPTQDSKVVMPSMSDSYDYDYKSLLFAYSFCRQLLENNRQYTILEVKNLFCKSLTEKFPTLNLYNLNSFTSVVERKEFSISLFCEYIGCILFHLKEKEFKRLLQPWTEDSFWVNTLENTKEAKPEYFYMLKYIKEAKAYFMVKSTLNHLQEQDIYSLGAVGIGESQNELFMTFNNVINIEVYDLDLSGTDKMNLYKKGNLSFQFKRIDIHPNGKGMYIHEWNYIISKIVTSQSFQNKIDSIFVEFSEKMGVGIPVDSLVVECIKTKKHLLYKLKDSKNQEFWIKIELSDYPELNIIQPSHRMCFLDDGNSHFMTWPTIDLRISMNDVENISNEDIANLLGLNKADK